MTSETEELRRRLHEAEAEIERLGKREDVHMQVAGDGRRTSAGGADLLFTVAERTRMAQILTDPNLPDNPIVFANRAFQEMSGFSADELIGRNCRFLQGPDTDPIQVAKVKDAIAGRRDVVVELVNYHRDGTPFRNELYVSPVFDPDGSLRYFFASQLDVTRFRNDEKRLAESEARYQTLFEAVDTGFCVVEMRFDGGGRAVDYRFVEVNPAFERQTGLRDATGRWVGEVIPDLEQTWFDTYGAVATTGVPVRFESGAVALGRWFDVHALRVGDPSRGRVAILFNDITDRHRLEGHLEAAARERTDERDTLWRASRDLFLICGYDGLYRAVNPAWTATLGWEPEELIGRRFDTLVHPDDLEATERAFERIGSLDGFDEIDLRVRTKDGSYRWISWNVIPRGDHFYAAGRDITERKVLEEQLRQSQKLEAIGQLTGGVAHDFNNLLTVIKSSTDLLKRPDLPEERRNRYVGAISDTVDRAARLTGQLLAFARRQALRPEAFDVGRSVAAVGDMIGTLTGARITVWVNLNETACFIQADPSQFDTALVNMAINARDAMDGEGRLDVTVRTADAIPATRSHPAIRGSFVAVSIADTGTGIESEKLERIFEPFYTTKGVGQGTGLGLSQVFGFAKQSGGDVTVESELGRGTTFTLYMPRVEAALAIDALPEPDHLVDGHGTRVLVVEDNLEVGAFATRTLAELGYVTIWAHNAAEALARLEQEVERFDVVFSDVVMPGMTGIELGREIARAYPALPVVLTSGYSDTFSQHGTSGFELLRKPYSVEALSRTLRSALTSKGPRP